jgi:hypothetical protein
MTAPDPKVVLQAHTLRTAATRQALVHGTRAPRTRRTGSRALLVSFAIAVGIAIVIIVITRVAAAVHH